MDTTLKQRILGIIILVAILGFCLTALLRNTKPTQPHIAKINTQPFAQQNTAETPSAKPAMPIITEEKPAVPVNTITTPSSPTASMPAPAPAPTPTKATTVILPPPVVPSQKMTEIKPAAIPTTPVKKPALAPAAPVQETLPAPAPQEALFSQQPISKQPVSKKAHTVASPVAKEHKVVPHKHPHSAQPIVKAKSKTTSALANQKDLMVQVGTFTVAGNAKSLVDKLHAKGFSATAQKIHTSKGEMTRVIVGKNGLNYTQAEDLRRELHQSMQLPGIIVSHAKD